MYLQTDAWDPSRQEWAALWQLCGSWPGWIWPSTPHACSSVHTRLERRVNSQTSSSVPSTANKGKPTIKNILTLMNMKSQAYQWVSTPGRDGTSRRDDGGWHMSCDKPNSWQRAWRFRSACNIKTIPLIQKANCTSEINKNRWEATMSPSPHLTLTSILDKNCWGCICHSEMTCLWMTVETALLKIL